jgi:integration host factor subunit alpha
VKGGPTMSDTLTKAHIINAVIEQNGFTRKKSIKTVETILEIIKRTMASGDDVLISGFGKFCIKQKTKRKGRNPATGEDMILSPRRVVTFKCSGKLRGKINR